jgi:hypothetical protein
VEGDGRNVVTPRQLLARYELLAFILKGLGAEILLFRCMLITQACALMNLVLLPHPILTKLVLIVPKTGGYKFLKALGVNVEDEDEMDQVLTTMEDAFGLPEVDRGNGMDCILCEAQEHRTNQSVLDVFTFGQDLFTIDRYGRSCIKPFGSCEWRFLHSEHGRGRAEPDFS